MTTLSLVRHAESVGNVDGSQADTPLSERGRAQASALGGRLRGRSFDLIVSSPLVRARETARLAVPGARVQIDERLGEWATLKDTYIDPAVLTEALLSDPRSLAVPKVESFEAFQARLDAWARELPGGSRVLAFTHYAVVRECVRRLGVGRRVLDDVPHCHMFEVGFEA